MNCISKTIIFLKNCLRVVLNQYGKMVKTIRSDNGGGILNTLSKEFFDQVGIIHHTSCSYSPQHNKRMERKHRHLLNVA